MKHIFLIQDIRSRRCSLTMKMIMEGMRFCKTPPNFSLNEVTYSRTLLKIRKVEQQTYAKCISLTCVRTLSLIFPLSEL